MRARRAEKRSGKEQSGVVYLHHVQHAHRNREWQTELSMEGQTELTTWLAFGMPQEAILTLSIPFAKQLDSKTLSACGIEQVCKL